MGVVAAVAVVGVAVGVPGRAVKEPSRSFTVSKEGPCYGPTYPKILKSALLGGAFSWQGTVKLCGGSLIAVVPGVWPHGGTILHTAPSVPGAGPHVPRPPGGPGPGS